MSKQTWKEAELQFSTIVIDALLACIAAIPIVALSTLSASVLTRAGAGAGLWRLRGVIDHQTLDLGVLQTFGLIFTDFSQNLERIFTLVVRFEETASLRRANTLVKGPF